MILLSPGMKILAELRSRRALRLSSSLALNDYEDLASEIQRRLPEGVSRANPSDQVATAMDSLDYFKTAPAHEQKIALMRLHGVPDHEIAAQLRHESARVQGRVRTRCWPSSRPTAATSRAVA